MGGMRSKVARLLFERGGLISLVALVLYVWIAPPHLSTGDNAEFVTLGDIGGAAHPSGYPLYVLWLRVWSWLPAHSPAHAAALATCLLGGLTVFVLHAACRAWGASAAAASFAVGLVAAAPIVVRLHTEAEVFALNGLIVATVLWLAAERGPARGMGRAVALGLVAGLGISNHLTCVFVAPIGLFGAIRGVRESSHHRIAVIGAALGALAVGLLPYAYLLIVPETRGSWGKVASLQELLHHFLRMDYGGPGELAPKDRGGTALGNVLAMVRTHGRGYLWIPLALGLIGFAAQLRRPRLDSPSESRFAWLLLGASWLLTGPLLIAQFNLRPDGLTAYVTQRFHMLPMIVIAIPIAVGIGRVGQWGQDHSRSQLIRSPLAGTLLPVIALIGLVMITLPRIASARSPATERALSNMLRTLPPDAVVIGTPDDFHFGMGYLQGALGERPDVEVITWQLVGLPYARDRIRRHLGIIITEQPVGTTQKLSVAVAEQILATGRPLFIDPFQAGIATSFTVSPYGLLYRVLPRGAPQPTIQEIFATNQKLYERYEFGYEFPSVADIMPAQFHVHYATTWKVIAEGLERANLPEQARYAKKMAYALAPEL